MALLRPWTIGKISGIPIRIDPSWVVIFLLLTYQLATFVFPSELGRRRSAEWAVDLIAVAALASVLLFASVLAHELGHAFMARWRGVPVLGITLFIFGGVAQISDEPDTPKTEFLIAVVGPLVSLLIAILAGVVWMWTQAFESLGWFQLTPLTDAWVYIAVVAFYLAQANLLLALFNLLPGFPLDGGRALRAGIWAVLRDQRRATYWGMVSGRTLALGLVGFGLFLMVRGDYGGGWLLLMAWFLWRAAGEAYHAIVAREMLKQVSVRELMRAPVPRISEALSLREVAEAFASSLRPPAVAVDLSGAAVGLVSAEHLERVDRKQWATTRVRQAMQPVNAATSVVPETTALNALQRLSAQESDQIAVIEAGQVVGSIGRRELSRYLQSRGE